MRKLGTLMLSILLTVSLLGSPGAVQAAGTPYYEAVLGELQAKGIDTAGSTFMFGDSETTAVMLDDPSTPVVREGKFHISGLKAADVTAQVIEVTEMPFTRAFRVRTGTRDVNGAGWMASLKGMLDRPVKQGDVFLLKFYARNVTDNLNLTQTAVSGAAMKKFDNGSYTSWEVPGKGSAVNAGSEWREFYATFRASADIDPAQTPDEAWLEWYVYEQTQVMDIGGAVLINFGGRDDAFVRSLPVTELDLTYPGRSEPAAWREQANARIDRHRKGNIRIAVKDGSGSPIPDASVEVRMKEHRFPFGTAITSGFVNGTDADSRIYRQMLTQLFNKAVFDNDQKWQAWEGEWTPSIGEHQVAKAVPWLLSQGMDIRGHVYVYPNDGNTPNAYKTATGETLFIAVRDSILERGSYPGVKGNYADWDVVNEAQSSKDIQNKLKDYYLSQGKPANQAYYDWFAFAKQADPNAKLYWTDAGMLGRGKYQERLFLYEMMTDLLDTGSHPPVPVDGIGEQAHFSVYNFPHPGRADNEEPAVVPATVVDILEEAHGKFGLPIGIMEYDLSIDRSDPKQVAFQADYTSDFYTAAFSMPFVSQIMTWGFWEGAHWIPSAAYFNRDWSIRPNGQALIDRLYKTWWTEAQGVTDGAGLYETDGFLGTYEITVTAGGKTVRQTADITEPKASGSVNTVVVTVSGETESPDPRLDASDSLDNFDRIYRKSDAFAIVTGGGDFGGDASRAALADAAAGELVYKLSNLEDFRVKAFHRGNQPGTVAFHTSVNGTDWTPVPVVTVGEAALPDGWRTVTYKQAGSIHKGMAHLLRITVTPPAGGAPSDVQIGRVDLRSSLWEDVLNDRTPPAEVADLRAELSDGKVLLRWTDPSDRDLHRIRIAVEGAGAMPEKTVDKGVQRAEFGPLPDGTPLTFVVSAEDELGNRSAGAVLPVTTLAFEHTYTDKMDFTWADVGTFWTDPARAGYLVGRSGGWELNADVGMMHLNAKGPDHVVYRYEGLDSFSGHFYMNGPSNYKAYVSPDGSEGSWTEIPLSLAPPVRIQEDNEWNLSIDFRNAAHVPRGTRFLKLEVSRPADGWGWTAGIMDLRLNGPLADGGTMPLPENTWTDPFDYADTIRFAPYVAAHTGNWMPIYGTDSMFLTDSQSGASLVYHIPGAELTGLQARARMNVEAEYRFYASAVNSDNPDDWTEIPVRTTPPRDTGGYWSDFEIASGQLPAGTQYVKAVVRQVSGWASGFYSLSLNYRYASPPEPSGNADLASLTVVPGALTPAFDPAVTSYTVEVGHETVSVDVTAAAADAAGAAIKVDGTEQPGGSVRSIPLAGDTTVIRVDVTAENGTSTRTYTVTVHRLPDQSPPAEVADLRTVSGHKQLTLNWTDPSDADLAGVEIVREGAAPVFIAKGVQTAVFDGLDNKRTYAFTVRTVDSAGNKSAGLQVSGVAFPGKSETHRKDRKDA